ncbi:MAG TPA: YdeI/OmpD-associated family protein [Vicinamibacterales bacterium]|nr:YdeI/OmpD-associated family protein [Vicinamibacterales bacterium]
MQPTFFGTGRAFERWLAAHHRTETLLLVGFYTVASGKASIRFPEALDAALSYGWIDGLRKRLDPEIYTVRFTPRKKDSYWSAVNTKRAKQLIEEKRMKPAGLAAFKARDEEKTRRYSYERDNAALDAASLRALKADRTACAFFEALPPGMKRAVTHWIASAKREETRQRRVAHLIERSRAGKRIDLLNPSGTG